MVRNPIDIIPSFFYLVNTSSHAATTNEAPNEADPIYWNTFVTHISRAIGQQVEAMQSVENAVPTFYVRYEDLCINPLPVLLELFCFLLEVPSIEGTVVE